MLTAAILEAQNKRLREENDELRETIRQLRSMDEDDTPLPEGIPHLSPTEETILRFLLRRQGRTVTREAVYQDLYCGADHVSISIIDVYVCKLRKKLATTDMVIETVFAKGYKLVSPVATRGDGGEAAQLIAEAVAA